MNGAEIIADPRLWIQLGLTVGSVMATVYVGFVRLSAKFDSSQEANALAHQQLIAAIEKQNGYVREHTEQIARLRERISLEEKRDKAAPP
jgi:hypothetical protein